MSEFAPGHLGRGGFNYYGTIGTNRDEFVVVRKMSKVDWLEEEAQFNARAPVHA